MRHWYGDLLHSSSSTSFRGRYPSWASSHSSRSSSSITSDNSARLARLVESIEWATSSSTDSSSISVPSPSSTSPVSVSDDQSTESSLLPDLGVNASLGGIVLNGDAATYAPLHVVNRPLQLTFISLILVATLVANLCVIANIARNELKLRTVNFVLIRSLCIVDVVGAACVIPVPLAVTAAGGWRFGPTLCTATSVVTVALWAQHLLVVVMLKVDRVLAACLPIGRYPLLGVEAVTILVGFTWALSLVGSGVVTACFGAMFEPAVVLCIPDLPIAFFLVILTGYCAGLVGLTVAYIAVVVSLRRKQARVHNAGQVRLLDYRRLEKSALTSFLITICHFLLYLPAMLVVGLRGWVLHPVAIMICDLVVYCEFLIHPLVLLLTSTKLRGEVLQTWKRLLANVLG